MPRTPTQQGGHPLGKQGGIQSPDHPGAPEGGGGFGFFRVVVARGEYVYAHWSDLSSRGSLVKSMPGLSSFRDQIQEFDRSGDRGFIGNTARIWLRASSFELGVVAGLEEGAAKFAGEMLGLGFALLKLTLMFFLAAERRRLDFLSDVTLNRLGLGALVESKAQADAFVSEVKALAPKLPELLKQMGKDVSKEYSERWASLKKLQEQPGIINNFEAGEIMGLIAFDVIMLILTVIDGIAVARAAGRAAAEAAKVLSREARELWEFGQMSFRAEMKAGQMAESVPAEVQKAVESSKAAGKSKAPPNPTTPQPEIPAPKAKGVPEPTVSDPKLKNLTKDLYKGAKTKDPIGTGSTADAIRQEKITGKPVGGKFHTQKGQEYSRALDSWLKKNPNASPADREAAQNMLNDLNSALGD